MITVRRLAETELATLQPLFEAVFKTPISLDLLRWKYADGRGESWTIWDGDRLLLCCGVCFRTVLQGDARVRAAQLVDLMAAPKTVGLSRTRSPFAVLMHQLLAALPRPDNPAGIAFGFPSYRAMRLGELHGVYRCVGQMANLFFSPTPENNTRFRLLANLDTKERALIDTLWLRMAADLSDCAVGVRDAAYLERRYFTYPEKRYVVLLAVSRWLRQPLGLAVIRPDGAHPELLDLIGPLATLPAIIAAARAWLATRGGEALSLLLSEPFAAQLAPLASACATTEFRIMANPFSPPESLRMLENRWWLTGGDTDYR